MEALNLSHIPTVFANDMTSPSSMVLETTSGHLVDLLTPTPSTIKVEDIAHALARIPRMNGHADTPEIYSQAMYGIWIARYLQAETQCPNIALHGLLHNAFKAYTGELPSPVLRALGLDTQMAVQSLQDDIQVAIYTALDIPGWSLSVRDNILKAKAQAQAVEVRALHQSAGEHLALSEVDDMADVIAFSEPPTPWIVTAAWLNYFNKLMKGEAI